MKIETKLVQKGRNSLKHFGTINPPILFSSTLLFPTMEAYEKAERGEGFYEDLFDAKTTDPAYGIAGNQTNFALQEVIKELENGYATLLTSSGLSSITLCLTSFLKNGDHLLLTDSAYGPNRRFCNKVLSGFGVETSFYIPNNVEDLLSKVKPNTKVIFIEAPGSYTFEIIDFEPIIKFAKENNIITIIDNSWATPFYFKPLEIGFDVSIHAITKYINGHSDVLMGAITAGSEQVFSKIATNYKNFGASVSPRDCYEALRGIRSLSARLLYQQNSLEKILDFLSKQKCISEILAPSYPKFSEHKNWKKYFSGATPLFSIVLDKNYSTSQIANMIDNYEIFGIGASWGGFESLVRRVIFDGIRTQTKDKYQNSVIRYYIGLENPDDIIADLAEGFDRLR
ncbi:MAG: cystathionine beta-lyase [Rickettsiales bacterium]|nr:cystathionine beta-lyase [Rickettsiales bacterium]